MATNDNRAMVEAAEDILRMEQISSTQWRVLSVKMVEFAALAVAAERTRIAAELSIAYPGKGHDSTWLINFIDKLRGATDE